MDDKVSKKKMDSQIEELKNSSLPDEYGWELKKDGLNLFVDIPSPKNGKQFTLKVNFEDFPQQPPSYLFVDGWPEATDIREDKGICILGTREFFTEFGHEDREDSWDFKQHTLVNTLHKIYRLMGR